ncbi:hypothetical protein FACS1894201_05800 [Bacteroidia bacterium]|nr:hypothetical protein FACS1894201_05800 [Bacteroidia bacterium]
MKQKNMPHKVAKTSAVKPQQVIQDQFSWRVFAFKTLFMFAIVVVTVAFTDYKGYFTSDQSNNHTRRKWNGFYKFTKNKQIDVLVVGNSHVFTGIDPFVLSVATSSNCFLLGNAGAGIADAYFTLGEALQKLKPKVVVVETFSIGNSSKGDGIMSGIQSFEAHNNTLYKLRMMPELFYSDDWIRAWSTTIRNHSFLLTNKAQIEYNVKNPTPPTSNRLELGRFARWDNGLDDSTLHKYKTLGAAIDGTQYVQSEHSKKYVRKIVELCESKGVPVLFFTVPMYSEHIAHYDVWKATLQNELQQYSHTQWYDLQASYDSERYTKDAFENTHEANQHLTNSGMIITAYKLADYLCRNYSLPNRSEEPLWLADFKDQPHFVFNQDLLNGTAGYTSIVKNKQVGKFLVKELLVQESNDYNRVIIKVADTEELTALITPVFQIQFQNQIISTPIQMYSPNDVFPPHHKVYITNLRRDMKILGVNDIQ